MILFTKQLVCYCTSFCERKLMNRLPIRNINGYLLNHDVSLFRNSFLPCSAFPTSIPTLIFHPGISFILTSPFQIFTERFPGCINRILTWYYTRTYSTCFVTSFCEPRILLIIAGPSVVGATRPRIYTIRGSYLHWIFARPINADPIWFVYTGIHIWRTFTFVSVTVASCFLSNARM